MASNRPSTITARYDRGDYERAISDYDRAIAHDKLYTAAYTNRGRAYEKKSDVTRARADYNLALSVPAKFNDGQWAHDTARERLKALDSSQ